VLERLVDRSPAPRIVHEEHAGNGDPPKHVERQESLACGGRRYDSAISRE
jgi:hypothetical protein